MRKKNLSVRELRLSLRLSQKEFAKELGVCRQSITAWETGNRIPAYQTIRMIEGKYSITLKKG